MIVVKKLTLKDRQHSLDQALLPLGIVVGLQLLEFDLDLVLLRKAAEVMNAHVLPLGLLKYTYI